jgi:hypothetical protein
MSAYLMSILRVIWTTCVLKYFAYNIGTLVYTGPDGIKSSATTAKALAAASPFLANGVLYMGEKIDKVVKIDLQTGHLLSEFGHPGHSKLTGNESILMLGRTDFRIRAFDASSGLEQVI